jgi:hypothetical protein
VKNWDVEVMAQPDEMRGTHDLLIRVKVPYEEIHDLSGGNAMQAQHDLVELVAAKLHRFVDEQMSGDRLRISDNETLVEQKPKMLADGDRE